jgi:hypothetical protein
MPFSLSALFQLVFEFPLAGSFSDPDALILPDTGGIGGSVSIRNA